MSPTKFKPLLAATVMSAIYMAGVPTTAQAVVQNQQIPSQQIKKTDVKGGSDYVIPESNKDGQRRYIVQLEKEPAISPTASSRQNIEAYVNQLITEQNALESAISSTLNRSVNSIADYQRAYNGIALMLSEREASIVSNMNNVKQVHLDKDYVLHTDAGPQLIGADNLWNGTDPDVGTATGEGIVVGVIDSGINSGHPSFAETDVDGYIHTNPLGAGNYLGACDPSNTDQYVASFTCNDKLIGGYDFVNGLQGSGTDILGPEDENGHGSHTASTAAGNKVENVPLNELNVTISGVAKHANVIMYDACYTATDGRGLCPGVSTLASVEQAIEDGIVDVINYSIGGGTSPWDDPVSMAFLSATQAGIFVSASAGNSGPGAGTLGHNEPWTASVAATTHNRQFTGLVTIGTATNLQNIDYSPGDGPEVITTINADMRYAGDVDSNNLNGCDAWPSGNEFDGEIALVDIYECPFADKVTNASAAGAVAVVVISNAETRFLMGGLSATTIPAMTIARSKGLSAITELSGGTLATEITPASTNYNGQADVVARFSSRGPSPFEYNKPDVAAPGVAILAAYYDTGGTDPDFATISGTSMAAPHNAGSAALLMQLNPDWSVQEVKSALMMKAVTAGVTKDDGSTQADPFDIGAGRIQVDNAAKSTLVLDETASRFMSENPATGGDLTTLNVASLTDYECEGTCTFTRTFRSVADDAINYDAALVGVTGTVTPSNFTVPANGFQTVTVEVDATALPADQASFGQLVLSYSEPSLDSIGAIAAGGAIPDDDFPGNSFCADIVVSGVTYPLTEPLSIDLGLEHTWVGDLTITLENPNGDVLGLMSRAGAAGDTGVGNGGDAVAGSTLRFLDSASDSAEDFNGCAAGTTCVVSPFPDTVANPPNTLADLTATDVNGTWEICAGDSAGGDTGNLNSAELNLFDAGALVESKLPIVVVAKALTPEIEITPPSLSFTVGENGSASDDIIIQNTVDGTAPLDWALDESSSLGELTVFQQPNSGFGGLLSDYFVNDAPPWGNYTADNFWLTSATDVSSISFQGWMRNAGDIMTYTDSIGIKIYADNSGEPDGHPETPASAIYEATIALSSPHVSINQLNIYDSIITVDIVGALGSAWNLAAGDYWIGIHMNNIDSSDWWLWGTGDRDPSDPYNAMSIDPTDNFGDGTGWKPQGTDPGDEEFSGVDINIMAAASCQPLPAWLSLSSTGNTAIPVGGFDQVDFNVDATGLMPGMYQTEVCISSNDIDEPFTLIQVELEVSDLIFKDGFEGN